MRETTFPYFIKVPKITNSVKKIIIFPHEGISKIFFLDHFSPSFLSQKLLLQELRLQSTYSSRSRWCASELHSCIHFLQQKYLNILIQFFFNFDKITLLLKENMLTWKMLLGVWSKFVPNNSHNSELLWTLKTTRWKCWLLTCLDKNWTKNLRVIYLTRLDLQSFFLMSLTQSITSTIHNIQ